MDKRLALLALRDGGAGVSIDSVDWNFIDLDPMKETPLQPALVSFLTDLAANNNREWFQANKLRYERELRDPWKGFVEQVLGVLSSVHDDFKGLEAKDCIFRIHRDTRFSKDKTPYKLHVAANISSGGKQSSVPGIYTSVTPESWIIGGGAYWLSKDELHAVRTQIMDRPNDWAELTNSIPFNRAFGSIQGERNKRLPAEWMGHAEANPDLFLKQFYYMHECPVAHVLANNALDYFRNQVLAAEPLRQFLRKAIVKNA